MTGRIMKQAIQIILFLLFFLQYSYAQQNPSGIKWKYIDTGVYKIIFPEEITPAGKRMADLMLHYEKYNYSSIKTSPRRIPIVLINQNAEANGFVSPAPFYSHWYTTPSSFDGIEWFRGLAIHEGRHMVQMNKLKDGAGKGAWRLLFGELGTAAFQVIYVPAWFMEGDAVSMETALTKGGRGRLPYFSLWHRGLELSGNRYSYYKDYLGSYDSLYPRNDHYRLGYLLCSYIQRHYGVDVWNSVLEDTGKYFIFFTFDSSLKYATGKSITELYNDAFNEYNLLWNRQTANLKLTDASIESKHYPRRFDSFLFPVHAGENRIYTLKFSRNRKLMLGSIDKEGKFDAVKRMPYEVMYGMMMNEKTLSSGGGKFLWRETIPDPRWGYRSYLDLKLYDSETDETVWLSDKRRFIASAISHDGEKAAAIEYTRDLRYRISLFDINQKIEISSSELKNTGHIFDPAVSDDGKYIAVSSLSDNGNAILIYNTLTRKIINLIDYTFDETFRAPEFFGKYLIYVSNYSGIDNIYAIDIEKKKRYQVTSRKFGAYYPSVNTADSTMLFNDYTANGYSVAKMDLRPESWIPIEKVERNIIDTIEPIAKSELQGNFNTAYNVLQNEYKVKNYHPLLNSINFFGWFPALNSTDSEFYISLLSRDVLHTTDLTVSYIRNFNEGTNAGMASLTYSGLYPVFTLSGVYGERAVRVDNESGDSELDYITWKETTGFAGIHFPLDFSRGIHSTSLTFGGKTGYIHITDKTQENWSIYNDINKDGDLYYYRYFLSFSHIIRGALSSVTPGVGEVLQLSYTHTPHESDYKGNLFSADLKLYLPGFTDTQGLIFKGSYEKINYKNYVFSSQVLFPRGYDSVRYEHFIQGGADYAFPICNVSFNIWKLIYFKRINGDLFFDYGAGKGETGYTYYKSAGIELTAEQNLLSNLYLAVEAGLRYSYCFDTPEHVYEFVFKTPVY